MRRGGYTFVGAMFSLVSKIKRSKINSTKTYQADLDSPRRELSNGGLGIVAALLVTGKSIFCVFILGGPIQL